MVKRRQWTSQEKSQIVLDLNKHSASRPCPQDMIDTIVRANVDFMITAVGD